MLYCCMYVSHGCGSSFNESRTVTVGGTGVLCFEYEGACLPRAIYMRKGYRSNIEDGPATEVDA